MLSSMFMFSFTSIMGLLKLNFILFFLSTGFIRQVKSECISPFINGDVNSFCYYYPKTSLSWLDGYNQCLSKTIDGILIEIFSIEQFNALKNININGQGSFWLGANNFALFRDFQWHWLDGTIVDKSVIKWCPNSTYEIAIGTYCAAYDSTLQCVTNYLCNTLLPAPCVASTSIITKQVKSISNTGVVGTGLCTNSYGGAYADWWTYSILLLNWFTLLCFILYLSNRFDMNKRTVIFVISIIIISFMLIIAYALLWGIQYQDLVQIPLIVVIIGCIASLLFLIAILILVSNRTRIQRRVACMILTILAIIIECLLMLGLILCIAYCSGYISLSSTTLEKDVIAALLAAIITAVSILFHNGILFLIGHVGQDRVGVTRSNNPNPTNSAQLMTTRPIVARQSQNNNGINPSAIAKKHDQIERATSPVDQRILQEFYSDRPKELHQYNLEGRQYVVYEGKTFADIDPYRKDLTQAMLLQEAPGLREALARVKSSVHASALAEEIRQAEDLLNRLK